MAQQGVPGHLADDRGNDQGASFEEGGTRVWTAGFPGLFHSQSNTTAGQYYCNAVVYAKEAAMIASFADRDTEELWISGKCRRLPASIQRAAWKKLALLNAAIQITNLAVPPGNRLEALHVDRAGQHSIRIYDKYRICFIWREGNVHAVEIVDYH